jgi:ABC-type phosphate transport system substrate-binding protein
MIFQPRGNITMSIITRKHLVGLISGLLGTTLIAVGVYGADKLGGRPFSDPAKQLTMPEAWTKQAIQHADWAKGADLTAIVDQQFYPLIRPGIEQYAKEKNLNIAVQEGTCGTANKGLSDKVIDIGGYCCPPSEADRFPGVKFHTVGIEAIPILVNAKNPVTNLTLEQVRQIFQGKLFRWSEVDVSPGTPGPKRIIQAVGRLHCKQRPGHWRLLLDNEDLFSPRLINVGSIKDMIAQVANNVDAIGLEELWMLKQYDKEGKVKAISINGVAPTDIAKVASGAYPFYNTLSVTTWETEATKNPKVAGLIKHLNTYMDTIDPAHGVASVSKLRAAGWKFVEDELVGEPH